LNSISDKKENYNTSPGDRVKVYPDILIAASRGLNGGAAKLWILSKHINPGGCGSIPSKALRGFVINDLKIKRGVYDVWLHRALAIGLLERKDKNIKIAGLVRAAAIVGAEHVKRPVFIELGKLIKKRWLAWVYAVWLANNKLTNRPISRATIKALSGICPRSQLEYERQAGIINHANYAKDTTRPGLQGMVDHINEFERDRIKSKAFLNVSEICWRLPNSREVNDQDITLAPKGRTRRVNSQLKDLLNIGGQDPKNTITRLYCQGDKQTKATLKHIAKQDIKGVPGLPEWVYQAADKKGFWHAIPT